MWVTCPKHLFRNHGARVLLSFSRTAICARKWQNFGPGQHVHRKVEVRDVPLSRRTTRILILYVDWRGGLIPLEDPSCMNVVPGLIGVSAFSSHVAGLVDHPCFPRPIPMPGLPQPLLSIGITLKRSLV